MHELVGNQVWTMAKLRVLRMERTKFKFHALYSNLFPQTKAVDKGNQPYKEGLTLGKDGVDA